MIETAIIMLAAVPANLFVMLYLLWSPPWESKHRADSTFLFLFIAGIAAMIDEALIRRFFGEFPGHDIVQEIIYLTICIQLYYALYLMIKLNRPQYLRKRSENDIHA